jgi:hypothetical protein
LLHPTAIRGARQRIACGFTQNTKHLTKEAKEYYKLWNELLALEAGTSKAEQDVSLPCFDLFFSSSSLLI